MMTEDRRKQLWTMAASAFGTVPQSLDEKQFFGLLEEVDETTSAEDLIAVQSVARRIIAQFDAASFLKMTRLSVLKEDESVRCNIVMLIGSYEKRCVIPEGELGELQEYKAALRADVSPKVAKNIEVRWQNDEQAR